MGERRGGGGRWSSSNGRGNPEGPHWELPPPPAGTRPQEHLHSELAMTQLGKAGRPPADIHPMRGDPWGTHSSFV